MKLSKIKWALMLAATLGVAAACDDDDDYKVTVADAPVLVSVTPSDTTIKAGDEVTIEVTYDKNVFFASSNADQISLTNGTITSASVIGSSATLTIVADCSAKGTTYTLNIPAGLVYGPSNQPAPAVTASFTTAEDPNVDTEVSNTEMSSTAKAVYDYMVSIYGSKTLSGMMANVNWNTECSDDVYDWTGKYPAMNFFDYIHLNYSPANWIDYGDITPAQDWWDNGGIVGASWHWLVPTSEKYYYALTEEDTDVDYWSAVQLTDEASLAIFAKAEVGDVIKVTTTDLGSKPQGSFKTAADKRPARPDGYESFDITGDYSMTITSAILDNLQSTGLIVSGQNYTITGVYLVAAAGDNLSYSLSGNNFDADNALTEGTWENSVFTVDLALITSYLRLLQEADIPVVWRPFHEASGGWFWWGKNATSFKAMWQYMYDYLKAEGINNLIWVWTSQVGDDDWYPGDDYVDIVGCDLYGDGASSCSSSYTSLTSSFGKMLALSECGYSEYTTSQVAKISEQWSAGAKWLYFMPWYDNDGATTFHSDEAWWTDAMGQDYVIDRASLPSFK